jgi:hypothetical protein
LFGILARSETKLCCAGFQEFVMNKTTRSRLIFWLFAIPVMGFFLGLIPPQAQAQEASLPVSPEKFSREVLAQMLAPIALYPDRLLSQILMASTYPLEVIEADRWVKKNPQLEGDPLDQALLDMEWDPSIKAICHFPAILAVMSERIAETTNLGNAFLAQEAEVMDMVQELRAKARAEGNLATTPEQQVSVEQESIIIEPTDPQVIHVPYYDPFYVYGPWWYPAYPPYYWGPAGVSLGIGIAYWPGIYFGYSWGTWGYFDWPRHHVYIHAHERPRYVRHDHWYRESSRWHHAPVHRRGVAYRDKYTATKYGQYPQRSRDYQGDSRGFPARREPEAESSRRGDERTRFDQGRRVDDNSRYERSQREQQRVERELQKREQQPRQPNERAQQKRPTDDRDRPGQERAGQGRQGPARVDRAPQEQQRIETAPQLRQRTDLERRSRESVLGEQPQRQRETVFDLPGNGRSMHQFSERGRSSRQELGGAHRDRSQQGGGKGPGRDGGGRSRR